MTYYSENSENKLNLQATLWLPYILHCIFVFGGEVVVEQYFKM